MVRHNIVKKKDSFSFEQALRAVRILLILGVSATSLSAEIQLSEMPEKISEPVVQILQGVEANARTQNLKRPLPSRPATSGSIHTSLDTAVVGKWKSYGQFGKLGSLLLAIMTAGIAAWRWLSSTNTVPVRSPIEELGTMVLFGKLTARLVRCADRVLVLADTPQGIVKLTEIEDPAMVARILREYVGT
jgi:flagellar biogenesis protein FliO